MITIDVLSSQLSCYCKIYLLLFSSLVDVIISHCFVKVLRWVSKILTEIALEIKTTTKVMHVNFKAIWYPQFDFWIKRDRADFLLSFLRFKNLKSCCIDKLPVNNFKVIKNERMIALRNFSVICKHEIFTYQQKYSWENLLLKIDKY